MSLAGRLVGEPAVGQNNRGRPVAPVDEVDLDQLPLSVVFASVPAPGEHEPARPRDLHVFAATTELLALRVAHHKPEPSALARIDLRYRRRPAGTRGPPAPQHIDVDPSVEDLRRGRPESALHAKWAGAWPLAARHRRPPRSSSRW